MYTVQCRQLFIKSYFASDDIHKYGFMHLVYQNNARLCSSSTRSPEATSVHLQVRRKTYQATWLGEKSLIEVASYMYADFLWACHAIFLPHECLLKPREHPLPLIVCIPITAVDFAPKIGWRSCENYFGANLCGLLCNKKLIINWTASCQHQCFQNKKFFY